MEIRIVMFATETHANSYKTINFLFDLTPYTLLAHIHARGRLLGPLPPSQKLQSPVLHLQNFRIKLNRRAFDHIHHTLRDLGMESHSLLLRHGRHGISDGLGELVDHGIAVRVLGRRRELSPEVGVGEQDALTTVCVAVVLVAFLVLAEPQAVAADVVGVTDRLSEEGDGVFGHVGLDLGALVPGSAVFGDSQLAAGLLVRFEVRFLAVAVAVCDRLAVVAGFEGPVGGVVGVAVGAGVGALGGRWLRWCGLLCLYVVCCCRGEGLGWFAL